MPTILLHGNTEHSPALRHELPVAIGDPLLFVEHEGTTTVLTSVLERERIAAMLPHVQILLDTELGRLDLVRAGVPHREAELETAVRALRAVGVTRATVPGDFPLALADRLRGEGIELVVDDDVVEVRRRRKTPSELAGIRRAQRAAEAGMTAAAALLRSAACGDDGLLAVDGRTLTAEAVREAIRAACAAHGAPAPPDVMVTSLFSGGGHDPGSGPLPAHLPITIDLWPRDEQSACWADMTRTFVVGEVSAEVEGLRALVREALEAARAAARPGISGRELYGVAAEIFERAGQPTQRTAAAGELPTQGFYFSLGHGVGLEVHEPPWLGLGGDEPLLVGDVIAIEPGVEGLPGIGGVRHEDLLLITEDGAETLTEFPYELRP